MGGDYPENPPRFRDLAFYLFVSKTSNKRNVDIFVLNGHPVIKTPQQLTGILNYNNFGSS